MPARKSEPQGENKARHSAHICQVYTRVFNSEHFVDILSTGRTLSPVGLVFFTVRRFRRLRPNPIRSRSDRNNRASGSAVISALPPIWRQYELASPVKIGHSPTPVNPTHHSHTVDKVAPACGCSPRMFITCGLEHKIASSFHTIGHLRIPPICHKATPQFRALPTQT